jgi:hypothetical protein
LNRTSRLNDNNAAVNNKPQTQKPFAKEQKTKAATNQK